jgi:pimeloyl-ACP methyl ester carboxylesterase
MPDAPLPPEIAAPLAYLHGDTPPAPAWFTDAIAVEPERFTVHAAGAEIECLAWGERGKPGLLFVHGASAHADWWSFIAPFFATEYRCAALSLSGMGGSGWRDRYDFMTFGEELDACARAAGLYESGEAPVYIGHSFGGAVVYVATLAHPERMRATILLDTGFGGPPKDDSADTSQAAKDDVRPTERKSPRGFVYRTEADALARFRFLPPQPAGNLFAADFIARRSLKRAAMLDGSGEGWTWRFDPRLFPKLDRSGLIALAGKTPGPAIHIHGDRSSVIARHGGRPKQLHPSIPSVTIPDADHHLMVDQPLALISAIRTALAFWPYREKPPE